MKLALLSVVVAFALIVAQMSPADAAPGFSFKKILKKGKEIFNKGKHVVTDKGACMLKLGVPQSVLNSAIACGPTAFAGYVAAGGCMTFANYKNGRDIANKCF